MMPLQISLISVLLVVVAVEQLLPFLIMLHQVLLTEIFGLKVIQQTLKFIIMMEVVLSGFLLVVVIVQ